MSPHSGAFIGRFSPIHLGHQAVIETMLRRFGMAHSIVIIGSTNQPYSERTPLNFAERRALIHKLYPELCIVGLPDFPNDDPAWLAELDRLLVGAQINPENVTFFSGNREDIAPLITAGRRYEILNRFDGTTPVISATEVRADLRKSLPIDAEVDPRICADVIKLFATKSLTQTR